MPIVNPYNMHLLPLRVLVLILRLYSKLATWFKEVWPTDFSLNSKCGSFLCIISNYY
jgi:hypothetical protein